MIEEKKKKLVNFLKKININVNLHTKARGNNGFYLKNRIDVSKNLDDMKTIEVLVHEFAHHIQFQLDKSFIRGGSIESMFGTIDKQECLKLEKELLKITSFVDPNSENEKFKKKKNELKEKIKKEEEIIKSEYPNFKRNDKFETFEKFIKNSDARYLLKYDIVKIRHGFFKEEKIISIDSLDSDFPKMQEAFKSYIRLKSFQRKNSKIQKRICQLGKYYKTPLELFARFIEGIVIDIDIVKRFAPKAFEKFKFLYSLDYYPNLKEVFEILEIKIN